MEVHEAVLSFEKAVLAGRCPTQKVLDTLAECDDLLPPEILDAVYDLVPGEPGTDPAPITYRNAVRLLRELKSFLDAV